MINAKIHGILDYIVVLFLWLSPSLFGLEGFTATFTYALGGVHLLLTILTKYSAGIIKIIPYSVHGIIEFLVAVGLAAFAYFYLAEHEGELARNYYYGFSGAVFLTWLLSKYKTKAS